MATSKKNKPAAPVEPSVIPLYPATAGAAASTALTTISIDNKITRADLLSVLASDLQDDIKAQMKVVEKDREQIENELHVAKRNIEIKSVDNFIKKWEKLTGEKLSVEQITNTRFQTEKDTYKYGTVLVGINKKLSKDYNGNKIYDHVYDIRETIYFSEKDEKEVKLLEAELEALSEKYRNLFFQVNEYCSSGAKVKNLMIRSLLASANPDINESLDQMKEQLKKSMKEKISARSAS